MIKKIKQNNNYEKIGPTAWGVAYLRTLSDIKYAPEIFHELEKSIKPTDPEGTKYLATVRTRMAPRFEARYKLADRLFEENKTDQILEIAAGLSPRGMAMVEENPALRYVEVDLPAMAESKRKIIKGLNFNFENLHIENGDALDFDSLRESTKYFEQKPIVVVSEGLMRYLNFDQKAVVANNVRKLLEKFGGAWITPDITLKRVFASEEEREKNKRTVKELSGIDVDENSFNNTEEGRKFFENLGFKIEQHGFSEIADQLVSPEKIGLSPEEVQKIFKGYVVFVMRVRQ